MDSENLCLDASADRRANGVRARERASMWASDFLKYRVPFGAKMCSDGVSGFKPIHGWLTDDTEEVFDGYVLLC